MDFASAILLALAKKTKDETMFIFELMWIEHCLHCHLNMRTNTELDDVGG